MTFASVDLSVDFDFQLVCLGKLLMSEFFDIKRPSGNLHILIGTFDSVSEFQTVSRNRL